MFPARTIEYRMYGPVSPSKLRTSSKSNATTRFRVKRIMKYRSAASATFVAMPSISPASSPGDRFPTSARASFSRASSRSSAFTP